MATLNDLIYRPGVQDGASAPLREIARAADAAGASVEQMDTRVGRTNATFAATAARLDPVERAIQAVERGTRSISAAMEVAQRQAQAEGVAQERLAAVMQAGARAKEEAALRAVRGLTVEQQALALTRAGYEQLAIQITQNAAANRQGSDAAEREAQALSRLRASLDPVYAAEQRLAASKAALAAQQEVLSAALARGAITQAQYARLIESAAAANQRGAVSVSTFAGANDNARASSGRFGQAMGQAGFQIQDFATQVSMGQNAMVAFGTQFAQFAGIFGTAGALAGAAVTIGVIAVQLLGAGDATKKLNDALRGSEEGYSRANTAAEAWLRGLNEEGETVLRLTSYYASLDAQRRAYEVRSLEASRRTLQTESLRLTDEAAGGLGGLQRGVANAEALAAARMARGQGAGEVPADIRAASAALSQFNATRADDPARALVVLADALTQAASAGGPFAGQLRAVVEELDKAVPSADRMTRQLGLNAAQLGAARGEAVSAAPAVAGVGAAANGATGPMSGLAGATQRAAAAMAALRARSEDPLGEVNAEIARLNQQLEALGRGGLDAYQRVLTAQERQAEITRIATRAQEQFTAALVGTNVPAAEAAQRAEEMGASFVAAATRQVDAAQQVTERVRVMTEATREAGRAARATGQAYAGMRDMASADELAGGVIRENLGREAQRQREREDRETQRAIDAMERQAEQSAQNISSFLADGFTNAFVNGERGFAGMLESFKRLAIATPIRIGVEALVSPLVKSALSGVTGAAGAAGGAGGLGELLGFAQAGRQLMGIMPGGAGGLGGSVTGLLQTELFTPAFGSEALTLGGAAGGIGGGFALGSIAGSFTAGDSRPRQQNSQIGAGVGAVAGTIVGGPLGGMVGGALGGAVGGLIGPGRGFSGGDVILGSDAQGRIVVDRSVSKNFDTAELEQQVRQQVAQFNATLAELGLRAGTAVFAAVGGGESGNPRDVGGALGRFGQGLYSNDNRIQRNIAGRTAEDALEVAGLLRSTETVNQFARAMQALVDPFDAAIAKARELGFAEADLVAARDTRVARLERDRNLELRGIGAALSVREGNLNGGIAGTLEQFDVSAAREVIALRENLERLGATAETTGETILRLERIQGAERVRIVEQGTQAMARAGRGLLEDLSIGTLGGLDPASRATAARMRLSAARAAGADGWTGDEVEELRRVANQTLPIIQSIEGITTSFAELVRGVAADALAASPGADSTGLAGVINATTAGADQVSSTVELVGGATVTELRNLSEQLARLAARMDAREARAAA